MLPTTSAAAGVKLTAAFTLPGPPSSSPCKTRVYSFSTLGTVFCHLYCFHRDPFLRWSSPPMTPLRKQIEPQVDQTLFSLYLSQHNAIFLAWRAMKLNTALTRREEARTLLHGVCDRLRDLEHHVVHRVNILEGPLWPPSSPAPQSLSQSPPAEGAPSPIALDRRRLCCARAPPGP